jgi:hypothetical protein
MGFSPVSLVTGVTDASGINRTYCTNVAVDENYALVKIMLILSSS